MNKKAISKYLQLYAEPEINIVKSIFQPKPWNRVLAIPCYGEYENLPFLISSINKATSFSKTKNLIIFVINNKLNTPINFIENNQRTIRFLTEKITNIQVLENKKFTSFLGNKDFYNDFLIIDRSSPSKEFPTKNGVGLARKIGADISLALFDANYLNSIWCFNTDGDAIIPEDYFIIPEKIETKNTSAFLTNFEHYTLENASKSEINAIEMYHQYLKDYVNGLESATSPYAFQTVGSTITINLEKYAVVRGFQKREAGEDFYLLNKLAKVGAIITRNSNPIQLQGRVSFRVPFGTGASVGNISKDLDQGIPYLTYDPNCFILLKIWLTAVEESMKTGKLSELKKAIMNSKIKQGDENLNKFILILEKNKCFLAFEKAYLNSKAYKSRMKHFHDWFDAFKTLKLIHGIRESIYPAILFK